MLKFAWSKPGENCATDKRASQSGAKKLIIDIPLRFAFAIAWMVKVQMSERAAKRRYGRERDTVAGTV